MVDPEAGATLFRDARRRIIALATTLNAEQLNSPVPACPQWTVRDLLGHLAGGTADVVHNNLAGAPGEEWTAAQVSAQAARSVAEILEEWNSLGPGWKSSPAGPSTRALSCAIPIWTPASRGRSLRRARPAPPAR